MHKVTETNLSFIPFSHILRKIERYIANYLLLRYATIFLRVYVRLYHGNKLIISSKSLLPANF